jgi:hypothetical protein
VGVGAKGEAGVAVPEVVGKLLDRDALREQDGSVEVSEGVHTVGSFAVVEAGGCEGRLPDDLVEQVAVADASVIIGDQEGCLVGVAVSVLPRERERCGRVGRRRCGR